jgi:hypothetical protein
MATTTKPRRKRASAEPRERRFQGRVLGLRESEDGARGEADILLAVFDVPDTEVAVGNEAVQVIDPGAFRTIIESGKLGSRPFGLDHFDAHIYGYSDSRKTIGKLENWEEVEEFRVEGRDESLSGLQVTAHYNLRTDVGRFAWEVLNFMPELVQYSFRWPADEKIEEGEDGMEHVTEFSDVIEGSQVVFGAQALTGAANLRTAERELLHSLRTAIKRHSTATDTTSDWDASVAWRNIPEREAALRAATAWFDPEGDPDTKTAYRFIHHNVGTDGRVGAANMRACANSIAILNGGRKGTTIPEADRPGVHSHMAGHYEDADMETPELRERAPGDEVLEQWMEDADVRGSVALLLLRHHWHGEKVPPKPSLALLKEWMKDESFAEKVKQLMSERTSQLTQRDPLAGLYAALTDSLAVEAT